MAEILENIRVKIRRLDWMYDMRLISSAEYNARLDYLLDRLENLKGVRK